MPGDPKECRQRALNCMLLAKDATTALSKQTSHNLAQSWTRLAAELEQAQTFLRALNGVEIQSLPDSASSPDEANRDSEAV